MSRELQVGDTIKCHDAEEMIEYMYGLHEEGVETDFEYEMDGVKGLWLRVISVKKTKHKQLNSN